MKKLEVLSLVVLIMVLMSSCASLKEPEQGVLLESPYEYVLDAGVYTSLDFEMAEQHFEAYGIQLGGACTAVAKTMADGSMVVGRNLDMFITDKSSAVFRVQMEGFHELMGITYMFLDFMPSYKTAMEHGVPDYAYKFIPFASTDVLNAEGLYIETNMRYDEPWAKGPESFKCTGTNPEGMRLHMAQIPLYVGLNCSDIDEALEFVSTLDVYNDKDDWNFAFMLADASGRYGVLELARNKVYWLEGQSFQTNFYINEELADISTMDSGVGRYDKVQQQYDSIHDQKDMKAVMESVTYFQYHFPETCQYDPRSEWVGDSPKMTYAYVTAPENQKKLQKEMASVAKLVAGKTRAQMQKAAGAFWETTYSVIANCNEQTMEIRFYEDSDKTLTIRF